MARHSTRFKTRTLARSAGLFLFALLFVFGKILGGWLAEHSHPGSVMWHWSVLRWSRRRWTSGRRREGIGWLAPELRETHATERGPEDGQPHRKPDRPSLRSRHRYGAGSRVV